MSEKPVSNGEENCNLLQVLAKLHRVRDMDALLETILIEAKRFAGAESASLYLLQEGRLRMEYVLNDRWLKQEETRNRFNYLGHEVALDHSSMAGFAACSRRPLNVADAYAISSDQPFGFNTSFDRLSSYRTVSVLSVPMLSARDELVGVMQVINARDRNGDMCVFDEEHIDIVSCFAGQAAVAIEKARMTREMILRLIRVVELRDPRETAHHVTRVGSYAVEIYGHWASSRAGSDSGIRHYKDMLRMAAMLHDIGKVAIPDALLRKKGPLEPDEYALVKKHTVLGAGMFQQGSSEWDDMARDVVLHHHEHWDGNGYPGELLDPDGLEELTAPGIMGEEIPLAARIVAVADVYDALTCRRDYKEAWPENEVLDYIRKERGRQFDPEVVDSFLAVCEVFPAIRKKLERG